MSDVPRASSALLKHFYFIPVVSVVFPERAGGRAAARVISASPVSKRGVLFLMFSWGHTRGILHGSGYILGISGVND